MAVEGQGTLRNQDSQEQGSPGYPEACKSWPRTGFCSGVNGSSSERSEAGGQPLKSISKLLFSQDFRFSHFQGGLTYLHYFSHISVGAALWCASVPALLLITELAASPPPPQKGGSFSSNSHLPRAHLSAFLVPIFLVIYLFTTTGAKKWCESYNLIHGMICVVSG